MQIIEIILGLILLIAGIKGTKYEEPKHIKFEITPIIKKRWTKC